MGDWRILPHKIFTFNIDYNKYVIIRYTVKWKFYVFINKLLLQSYPKSIELIRGNLPVQDC